MIRNLIFDFGKVLVDYDYHHVIDPLFDREEEREAFKHFISQQHFLDQCEKEDIPFVEIIEQCKKEQPQWEHAFQAFYEQYADLVTGEIPGMKEVLATLRMEGYYLYGLTNWCSVVHSVIPKYPILQGFDGRVISCEEHLIKPDVAIYERLCQKYNLRPYECVFTDDKPANIAGAKAAGMQSILFKNATQYMNELRTIIKKNE